MARWGIYSQASQKLNFYCWPVGLAYPYSRARRTTSHTKTDATILYGCKTETDIVFKNELTNLNIKHFFCYRKQKSGQG